MANRVNNSRSRRQSTAPKSNDIYEEMAQEGLAKYYQPNQPHPVAFNRAELGFLKTTKPRESFDWYLVIMGTLGAFLPVPFSLTLGGLYVYIINSLLFYAIVIIEITENSIRSRNEFLVFLGFITWYLITNQRHLQWKTHNPIEVSKLVERSKYLERRLASTIVNSVKANLILIFMLRWAYDAHIISFTGTELNSVWSWVKASIDYMLFPLGFLDLVSVTGFSGFSSITPIGAGATIGVVIILLFNMLISLDSIKSVLQVIENKGNLPSWMKGILRLMEKFL